MTFPASARKSGVWVTARPRKPTLHMFVEGFDVFGVHIQYWMPLAVAFIAVAVALSWWGQTRP
jgi:hypothetical protein